MERKILEKLDYSHPWVTAKEHILQVYEEAKRLKKIEFLKSLEDDDIKQQMQEMFSN
jgi:hypothetical protein